jgi:Transposase DDE domain
MTTRLGHSVVMILSKVFARFVEKTPVTVMARAAMEHALAPEALDAMFEEHTDKQYTRELLFSSVVDLMGVVVARVAPSVHAAYQAVGETLPVSITSVYNKLNNMESDVTSALVRHTAERLAPVIVAMGGQMPELLPGYRVRILDGNHLAATERRLQVLHGSIAGPLPGHALVVLDPSLMLATHIVPCEDGHAQERSLSAKIIELVDANDVWLADRNFCTSMLLSGIATRHAFYVIRHHANMRMASAGTLKKVGRTDTGEVYEQRVTILDPDGKPMAARRVVIRLDKPTRDGDTEMAILTNLPRNALDAIAVAELYRRRWTLETMFQSLTMMLEGELATLGYPRAALFGFGVALAAYNVLSSVQAALRAQFGVEKIQSEVSGYYIANEVRATVSGMSIAIEPVAWESFQTATPAALAKEMLRWAAHVKLAKLKRHPRGEKKPVPKRTRFAKHTHVSTARLLAESRKKAP